MYISFNSFSPETTKFFQNRDELHVSKFINSFEKHDFILAKSHFKDYILQNYNDFTGNIILESERETITEQNIVTKSFSCSSVETHNGRKFFLEKPYFDFIYDVIPYLLSKPSEISCSNIAEVGSRNDRHKLSYAILATPRSGSSFLCSLLKSNVGGKPSEHLRNPLLYIIENRHALNINLEVLLDRIFFYCSERGVFGTKLISEFMFDALRLLDEREKKLFINHLHDFKIIYLHRNDKYAQAVSRYIASKSKSWHVLSSQEKLEDYHKKAQEIDYNFNAIKKNYENFVEQEEKLQSFIDQCNFKEVLQIEYEELKQNPVENLQKITDFCNVNLKQPSINTQSRYKVLSSDVNTEFIGKFKEEYESLT